MSRHRITKECFEYYVTHSKVVYESSNVSMYGIAIELGVGEDFLCLREWIRETDTGEEVSSFYEATRGVREVYKNNRHLVKRIIYLRFI